MLLLKDLMDKNTVFSLMFLTLLQPEDGDRHSCSLGEQGKTTVFLVVFPYLMTVPYKWSEGFTFE